VLAEEVVQEVFLRLWRRPERFDPDRDPCVRFCSLKCTADRSTCCGRRRRGGPANSATHFAAPRSTTDLERAVGTLSEGEAVRRALADLSEGERGAIELAYFGGHTYREVAQLLELPEGTVKSRIRSGLLRLRAALIDEGVNE